MQNTAFWCILGSENGQMLTSADPEGTARERGLGGEWGDAESDFQLAINSNLPPVLYW